MDRKLWKEAQAIAARRSARAAGDAAEDLAQDLAVAAIEDGGRARRPGAWLERVGRNAQIDGWRLEARRRELASEVEPPSAPADPESALLARERRGLVRRALALLPRPQRRAALLRFHGELPFERVASRLGTPEVTARTRVHRALGSLRAKLGGLRAIFVLPGAQTAALGLTLLAAELPAARAPFAIASGDPPAPAARPRLHARRVIASDVSSTSTRTKAMVTHAPPPRPDATQVPAVQHFDFGDEDVLGDISGPDGERLIVIERAQHSSLIEIRQHFVPEMVKSLEEF